jgi:cytochrome P450
LLGSKVSDKVNQQLLEDVTIWSKGLLSAPTTFIPWTVAGRAMRARRRIQILLTRFIEEERVAGPMDKNASILNRLVHSREEAADTKKDVGLSNDDIIDNALTLIFAGSDTTAGALTAAFYQLSIDPVLNQRLRAACCMEEEENNNNNNNNKDATILIESFVAEAQRAYPPAPFQARQVQDKDLVVGGYRIPKGWLVVYSLAGTLLADQDTYTKPDQFNVDRWLSDEPPPVWAFGGGKRMCPGKRLSFLESILLLKAVLGPKGIQWELEQNQNLEFQYTPGLFPVDGLKIKIV